jgi:hypothetical protein
MVAAPLCVVALIAVAIAGDVKRGGLRPCNRLDARLCADLGPAACDVWKDRLHRLGAASVEPHEWRHNRTFLIDLALHKLLGWDAAHADNPLCYTELEDEVYPKILEAVRGAVAAAPNPTAAASADATIARRDAPTPTQLTSEIPAPSPADIVGVMTDRHILGLPPEAIVEPFAKFGSLVRDDSIPRELWLLGRREPWGMFSITYQRDHEDRWRLQQAIFFIPDRPGETAPFSRLSQAFQARLGKPSRLHGADGDSLAFGWKLAKNLGVWVAHSSDSFPGSDEALQMTIVTAGVAPEGVEGDD